jgi:toxin-antitoxin system PIN domain toxin
MRLIVTPDLNVLLAASRSDHPQHSAAMAWLDDALSACTTGRGIEVLPMVAAGFLRLATNRKVFSSPTPIPAAVGFIDSLLAVPGVEMAELGREWPTLRALASAHNLSGNNLTDAWIAAAVRTIGSRLVTFDRGFARLLGRSELTILSPTSAAGL